MIPKHIWQDIPEKVNLDDPLKFPNEKPIGSGPFKLDYWDQGREYKATAFKEHFSPPKCAGIIGIVYGSHDAIAAAIEKGECDRTRYILKPSLLLDLQKVKNVVAKGYPNHGFYTLTYHTRRPPLDRPGLPQGARPRHPQGHDHRGDPLGAGGQGRLGDRAGQPVLAQPGGETLPDRRQQGQEAPGRRRVHLGQSGQAALPQERVGRLRP